MVTTSKLHLPGDGVHFLEVGNLREAAVRAVPETAALLHVSRGVLESYTEPAGNDRRMWFKVSCRYIGRYMTGISTVLRKGDNRTNLQTNSGSGDVKCGCESPPRSPLRLPVKIRVTSGLAPEMISAETRDKGNACGNGPNLEE